MLKIINAKRVQENDVFEYVEVLIENGRIASMGKSVSAPADVKVVNADGKLITPAFFDSHVHFREPGFEYKETLATGSKAAIKGGYTTVLAMPNTKPVIDNKEVLQKLQQKLKTDSKIDVGFFSAITKNQEGMELVDVEEQLKAGAVGFSDDGRGVQNAGMMYDAMLLVKKYDTILSAHCEENSLIRGGYIHAGEYAEAHQHKGIVSLCEDLQIARDCAISLDTGARYHICHMSTRSGVDLLRYYKSKCDWITGEVTPHHLLMTDEDLVEHGDFKMNPPLRSKADREALIAALADGTISCVATDHAPHSAEEKEKGLAASPFGIIGLETAFPLLYTNLVKQGKITLYRLIQAMSQNPAKIFRRKGHCLAEGEEANFVLIDLDKEYEIRKEDIVGKSKNTPFAGRKVFGKIDSLYYKGNCLMEGGNIIE